jgi:hypothetical protein
MVELPNDEDFAPRLSFSVKRSRHDENIPHIDSQGNAPVIRNFEPLMVRLPNH